MKLLRVREVSCSSAAGAWPLNKALNPKGIKGTVQEGETGGREMLPAWSMFLQSFCLSL